MLTALESLKLAPHSIVWLIASLNFVAHSLFSVAKKEAAKRDGHIDDRLQRVIRLWLIARVIATVKLFKDAPLPIMRGNPSPCQIHA